MKLENKYMLSDDAMAREVGGELVILDLASNTYLGLDEVGTRIWQLLESGKSLAEICDTLLEEYDVTRDVLEADTLRLAADLLDKALIKPA